MAQYSDSPSGEKFPLPQKEEYAAEYARIESLVKQARSEGKEIVVVMGVGFVGAVMAAKRTSDIVPMCHSLALAGVEVIFSDVAEPDASGCVGIKVVTTAGCVGPTGVEMEALCAAGLQDDVARHAHQRRLHVGHLGELLHELHLGQRPGIPDVERLTHRPRFRHGAN